MDSSKQFCRLCFAQTCPLENIFSQGLIGKSLCEKIQLYLDVTITNGEKLKTFVCELCVKTIGEFDVYYKQVQDVQRILLDYLENSECENQLLNINEIQTLSSEQEATNSENSNNAKNQEKPLNRSESINYFHSATELQPQFDSSLPAADIKQEVDENEELHMDCEEDINYAINPLQLEYENVIDGNQKGNEIVLSLSKKLSNSVPTPCTFADDPLSVLTIKTGETPLIDDQDDFHSDLERRIQRRTRSGKKGKRLHFFLNEIKSSDFEFPKCIVKEHKFQYQGAYLNALIEKFFNLSCDICPKSDCELIFEDVPSLFSHYESIHKVQGYVVCCEQKLLNKTLMAYHMARHIQPEEFTCKKCGKILSTFNALKKHLQGHLSEEKRALKCSHCPRGFGRRYQLTKHEKIHLPENVKNIQICSECNMAFSCVAKLSQHTKSAHFGGKFICKICGKQFDSQNKLYYHSTTHEVPVQCEVCKKWMNSSYRLRHHMNSSHSSTIQCHLCNYCTSSKSSLALHLRCKHSDERPFLCAECGKAFKRDRHLKNHMLQHSSSTAEKHKCEFCSREFLLKTNRYKHQKLMHPIEFAEFTRKIEEENAIKRELKKAAVEELKKQEKELMKKTLQEIALETQKSNKD